MAQLTVRFFKRVPGNRESFEIYNFLSFLDSALIKMV